MNEEELIEGIRILREEYNRQNEGRIHVDENGNRWIFSNGRWHAMCHVKPITFIPEENR